MRGEFSEEDRQIQGDEELLNLLRRLEDSTHHHLSQAKPPTSDLVTVEDIAEALDLDPDYVAEELRKLHQEQREARLVGVMKELEEPLYRVERQVTSQSLGSNPLYRLQSVRALMDRAKEASPLPRRFLSDPAEEKRHRQTGQYVLYAILAISLILILLSLLRTVPT